MNLLFLIIFGSSLFSGEPIAPSSYQTTPDGYQIGRGDSLVVDLYGTSQLQFSQRVRTDGTITIPAVGPVRISGMDLKRAKQELTSAISTRYAGSEIQLTIADPRKIEVVIRGEVARPGRYMIHGFSTLIYALQVAGGITDEGSMRSIELRQGKTAQTLDLYNELLIHQSSTNLRIIDGAEILVPTAGKQVQMDGLVKRQATYELMPGQTVADILAYAGGTTEDDVQLRIRHRGAESHRVETIDITSAQTYEPADGDIVEVEKIPDEPESVVQVLGNVQYGGKYLINGQVNSLRQIIKIANPQVGEKANIVVVYRDTTLVQVGDKEMRLQGREKIYVLAKTITIGGEVLYPTPVDYEPNKSIRDYIKQAGGFTRQASRSKVYVVTPDGRVIRETKKLQLIPGSQIIVPKR